MIALWMLGATVLALLAAASAWAAERALRLTGRQGRAPWMLALAVSSLWPLLAPFLVAALPDGVRIGAAPPGAVNATGGIIPDVASQSLGWRAVLARFDTPLLILWGAVSMVLLVRFLMNVRALRRLARHAESDQIDGVAVLVTANVGPAVFGAWRPRIVIPSWLAELDASLRSLVLKHEAEHVRSGDSRTLALAHAVLTLLPWNAGLWWIARRLRVASELDCDTRVLRGGADPRTYGQLLMLIAQRQGHATFSPMMAGHPSTLHARINAMHAPVPNRPMFRAAVLTAVALVAGAFAASPTLARELAAVRPIPSRSQGTPQDTTKKPMREFKVADMANFAPGSAIPRYPQALKDAGTTGTVIAQMVVDTGGTAMAGTLKIIRAADPAFVTAIKDAMDGMRFVPARVDGGRHVRQLVQIQFRFAIPGKPAPTDTIVPTGQVHQLDVLITGVTR